MTTTSQFTTRVTTRSQFLEKALASSTTTSELITRKGYIDNADLAKINKTFGSLFNEDDLEGLMDIVGKVEGVITFDNYLEFISNNNS